MPPNPHHQRLALLPFEAPPGSGDITQLLVINKLVFMFKMSQTTFKHHIYESLRTQCTKFTKAFKKGSRITHPLQLQFTDWSSDLIHVFEAPNQTPQSPDYCCASSSLLLANQSFINFQRLKSVGYSNIYNSKLNLDFTKIFISTAFA